MFHTHQWTEAERLKAPPSQPLNKINGELTPEFQATVDRWVFGVTTIILRCECGDLKTVEVLGT